MNTVLGKYYNLTMILFMEIKTKFLLLDTFKRHFIGSVISYKANIISHLVDDGGKVMTYSFH